MRDKPERVAVNVNRTLAASPERSTRFQYLTSAVDLLGWPKDDVPEIALAGRSNAGKSSFLNALAKERVARVSSSPGKTTLLNFYQGSTGYRLVDMPGYGYAKRSADERDAWAHMIEPYLSDRRNLIGVFVFVDMRRPWAKEERDLVRWIEPLGLQAAVILTKSDKETRSAQLAAVARMRKDSGISNVFAASAMKKTGITEIENFAWREWLSDKREKR